MMYQIYSKTSKEGKKQTALCGRKIINLQISQSQKRHFPVVLGICTAIFGLMAFSDSINAASLAGEINKKNELDLQWILSLFREAAGDESGL